MSDERFRINDDSPLSTSVPEAPVPLAKSVLERFRYGARKATAQVSSSPEGVAKETLHFNGPFGSTFSQTTSHRAGLKIRALDINQFRTHVVLAGGKLLKTVRINQEPSCIEDFNLHTVAVNYAGGSSSQDASPAGRPKSRVHDSNSVQRDMFDIEDVAWSNNEFREYIATAARNGKIMLYDMNRPGVEVGSLHEHYRQVHKVDFNPMEGACLLSGSQDGTVRLWDLRNYRKSAVLGASMMTFAGRSEGVRHVKWSPRDTWSFAFGTDNGVIQRWDTRNNRKPVLKFSAHHETCNSIDWHPDGRHLVSAGKDRVVKVWDISPDAIGRASFSVRTPREVQNVRWRPSCFVTDPFEYQTIKQCTHFATSYRNYPVVQVWDLRRPHIPFREVFHRFNNGTTDMLWRSRDLLWTVGAEGEFNQTDIPFITKTIDRRSLASVSCGPGGQVTFVSQGRGPRGWPTSSKIRDQKHEKSSLKGEKLPLGRSPGDDSFDEKFLEPTLRSSRSRAASIKSVKSLGATPPSTDEMTRMITTDLMTTMNTFETFKPRQAGRFGLLPGASQTEVSAYLHQNYKFATSPEEFDLNPIEKITSVFEQNANFAQKASSYREAQMWRVLGHQISKELQHRRALDRKRRLINSDSSQNPRVDLKSNEKDTKISSAQKASVLTVAETSSNSPTPIIHAKEKPSTHTGSLRPTEDQVQLPPTFEEESRVSSTAVSSEPASEKDRFNSDETEERIVLNSQTSRDASLSHSPELSRASYNVDGVSGQAQNINVPGRTMRRNSSESFWMFSTSSDSASHHIPADSFRSSNNSKRMTHTVSHDSEEGFEFNSSFRSNDSASQPSPQYGSRRFQSVQTSENQESFFDLPTHGNLHLDDFIDSRSKRDQAVETEASTERSISETTGEFNYSLETSPPLKRPQYRLADQDEPLAVPKHNDAFVAKASSRQNYTISSIVPSAASAAPTTIRRESQSLSGDYVKDPESKDNRYLDHPTPAHAHEPSAALNPAIKSQEMISELLSWYASKGDALTATHIFLLVAPLLGDLRAWTSTGEQEIDSGQLEDILASSELLIHDQVVSVAKAQHASLNAIGILPEFVQSILTTYHEELMSLDLVESAAAFRKLTYPSFPAVYEQGLKDVQVHLICLGCSHPINNPRNKMYCESCLRRQEDCAICWCDNSPFDWEVDVPLRTKLTRTFPVHVSRKRDNTPKGTCREPASLWATCMICNHSTHVACADQWFADTESEEHGSGGACPVPSCLCDCVRGWYRDDRLAQLEARERQKRMTASSAGAGSVKRDKWSVNESRAVGRVRGALRASGPLVGEATPGGGERQRPFPAGHLAQQGRTMSDEGKRVRLVAPHENGT